MSLNVLILPLDPYAHIDRTKRGVDAAMGQVLRDGDTWHIGSISDVALDAAWDLIVAWEPCGWSRYASPAALSGIPCMTLSPPLTFHPYHAAFSGEVESLNGILMPSNDPQVIAASLDAIRAAKALRQVRLVVVNNHENDDRAKIVQEFAVACRNRFGIEIVRRPAAELISIAEHQTEDAVEAEWARWLADVIDGPGEMPLEHMKQVVRLYLAERSILNEERASGITVDDIGVFLTVPERKIMPNASYGPLTMDCFLCCEEGDIEALTTQAILRAGLRSHPTMSNIYMAYRDALERNAGSGPYTAEMEREDYLQCMSDNHLVAAHFSTSGVLPPNMMVEDRYRVRQTLPAWPGQSMTASTPKTGPVIVGRLSPDASGIHLMSGNVDHVSMNDKLGWYRGRWMIKITSSSNFTKHCLHQHYAIGPENGATTALDFLVSKILRLQVLDEVNFPGR